MDETQLMGVAVETSAQLDGFREHAEWTPFGIGATWWMSATLDRARLATVDHPEPNDGWKRIELSDEGGERSDGEVRKRFEAKKPVTISGLTLSTVSKRITPSNSLP